MSDLKFLSDCKDEELIELRERNAKLVAALEKIADFSVGGYTAASVMREIAREALQQSTEKP